MAQTTLSTQLINLCELSRVCGINLSGLLSIEMCLPRTKSSGICSYVADWLCRTGMTVGVETHDSHPDTRLGVPRQPLQKPSVATPSRRGSLAIGLGWGHGNENVDPTGTWGPNDMDLGCWCVRLCLPAHRSNFTVQ